MASTSVALMGTHSARAGNAAVSGRAVELSDLGAGERPDNGVFAAAAAYDEYFHN